MAELGKKKNGGRGSYVISDRERKKEEARKRFFNKKIGGLSPQATECFEHDPMDDIRADVEVEGFLKVRGY